MSQEKNYIYFLVLQENKESKNTKKIHFFSIFYLKNQYFYQKIHKKLVF